MSVEKNHGSGHVLVWVKSSYSGAEGGQCVEVAGGDGTVHVRDSKDTSRPMVAVRGEAWTTFIAFAAL